MEIKEYYTPTIEELFIGYECEYKNADKWQGIVIAGIDEKEGILQSTQDSYYWQPSSIRTPYLCKQDILDLGWGVEGKLFRKGDFQMEIDFNNHKLQIYRIKNYQKSDFKQEMFYGICKSKNELKKLMKDYLNIETK